MDWFTIAHLEELGIILLKMVLAGILGGIIGIEREHKHRPAGLRTHILVCMGACLTMMISSFMVTEGLSTDVARLGAQVISGIGFLGAGTILREGDRVRGLTTAATLWAIACVGLAIGIGYYGGAIAAAFMMLIVLRVLGYIMTKRNGEGLAVIHVAADNNTETVANILSVIHIYCTEIKNIDFTTTEDDKNVVMLFTVKLRQGKGSDELFASLIGLEGVHKVD
ncbi:MAG: MgtC/SapB family protein [Clostridia bacterium]|nr:MgtC/SapB family protein [Clostridia bacterium]